MKLSLIKSLYTDSLSKRYRTSESEALFYIALDAIDQKSRTSLLMGADTMLEQHYMEVLEELKMGKPIQYIFGTTQFYSLEINVDSNTLIPRPETEELVHWVIEENKGQSHKILDIGTGSGCIALALKKHMPQSEVHGCDISMEALEVAKSNATSLNLDVPFYSKDILSEEIDKFDILVSNPPYISNNELRSMDGNVTDYEPHIALFVEDDDVLLFYKRIVEIAINQKSICYFETSEFYTEDLKQWLLERNVQHEFRKDFQGKTRLLKITH